ncbi:MAG: ATP synthase subunit I [Gammaproteobacteria bacterium]|nr:ATP synthase subunit I [Gammaproteobacteria bacterium]
MMRAAVILWRQLRCQLVSLFGMALLFALLSGVDGFLAALYGGVMVIANTLLLLWHSARAERLEQQDAGQNFRIIVRCALERFVMTVALFAFGLLRLGLEPLALISGFAAGQLLFIIGGIRSNR